MNGLPKGHGAKTVAVRERAVAALMSEPTIARAAKRAGVNERTLRRWLAEDQAFKVAYATARRATFQDAMDRIQVVTARAVETLEEFSTMMAASYGSSGSRSRPARRSWTPSENM
jgi:hypothetical protein